MSKIATYVINGIVIVGVGVLGGFIGNKYLTQRPYSAVQVDINGDKEPDLIIKDKRGKLVGYLIGTEKGNYESIESVLQWEINEFNEKKQKDLQEMLERHKTLKQELEKKVLEYTK